MEGRPSSRSTPSPEPEPRLSRTRHQAATPTTRYSTLKVHRSRSRCAASSSRKKWMATWEAVTMETATTASPTSSLGASSSNPSRLLPCQQVSSVSSTEVSNSNSNNPHSGPQLLNLTQLQHLRSIIQNSGLNTLKVLDKFKKRQG